MAPAEAGRTETSRAGGSSVGDDAGSSATPSVFSAPIAATRVEQADVVAGLVAGEGTLRAMKIAGGRVLWTSTVLDGVAWAPDAELRLQPASDGVVLVWRGLHNGRSGRTLVVLGSHGETIGAPIEIGTSFCATRSGLAWLDVHGGGSTHVRSRLWSEREGHEVLLVPADRDPGLVCGDREVVVLGDGEDDLTASIFSPGDATAEHPSVAIRDSDFGDDDEREHETYSMGDEYGLVRIGSSGSVAVREISRHAAPGPWRRLKHGLAADDDVVAVDGDANAILIVFTREASQGCPEGGAAADSVRVLRVDRKTRQESLSDLAPRGCGRVRGPFWIASAPGAPVIAWVERFASPSPDAPPIAGLAFRTVSPDGVRAGTIEQEADALVEASCDERGCVAAALLRTASPDGASAEAIRLLGYP